MIDDDVGRSHRNAIEDKIFKLIDDTSGKIVAELS
jgi:hypothetical protein